MAYAGMQTRREAATWPSSATDRVASPSATPRDQIFNGAGENACICRLPSMAGHETGPERGGHARAEEIRLAQRRLPLAIPPARLVSATPRSNLHRNISKEKRVKYALSAPAAGSQGVNKSGSALRPRPRARACSSAQYTHAQGSMTTPSGAGWRICPRRGT